MRQDVSYFSNTSEYFSSLWNAQRALTSSSIEFLNVVCPTVQLPPNQNCNLRSVGDVTMNTGKHDS